MLKGDLPVVFYFHGGGWILGSPSTHDSLVRDLVRQTGCAILFPYYYTPAPEAKFPQQLEEAYGCVEHFGKNGSKYGLVTDKIAFVEDSVGGHIAIGMSTIAAQRKLPVKVTSIRRVRRLKNTYKDGPYLTADLFRWMYAAIFQPKSNDRTTVLGSPVLMTKEQAATQPSTLLMVASVDPIQDEGKHFGHVLQQAGVDVEVFQADGRGQDFVIVEPTRQSPTVKAVFELAALKLKRAMAAA